MNIAPSPTHAAHLLTRAAWVATPEQIDWVTTVGIETAVDELLGAHDLNPPPEPRRTTGEAEEDDEVLYSGEALVQWFFETSVSSTSPALERLLWFWHGHFATSIEKVELPSLMHRQFQTLRNAAMGPLPDLVHAVTFDPAMNIWLDLEANVAGSANENYARELLELFTMGRDNGYTQRDVVELARALTGIQPIESCGDDRPTGTRLDPGLHDSSTKTVLGKQGRLGPDDVVAHIADLPETHEFIATRLWLRYAGTPIPLTVRAELATTFARTRQTRDVLRQMLTHEAFYTPDVRHGLVASPVETLVRTYRGLEIPIQPITCGEPDEIVWFSFLAGQTPAHPPHVGGWPHNHAWLDAAHSGTRAKIGRQLALNLIDLGIHSEPIDRIRTARRPADLAAALGTAFGVLTWSDQTAAALGAAAALRDEERFVAAIATAFSSPEVTLS